jgi:hypothetical protein
LFWSFRKGKKYPSGDDLKLLIKASGGHIRQLMWMTAITIDRQIK